MLYLKLFGVIFLMSLSFLGGSYFQKELQNQIPTQIFEKSQTSYDSADWGNIWIYTNDSTYTYGTDNMLTAIAEIKPNSEIHPPHEHMEEELLLIMEGEGTWDINGKKRPAKQGDLLYARPWDLHGIYNSGDTNLKFFVVKWNNRGVKAPTSKP